MQLLSLKGRKSRVDGIHPCMVLATWEPAAGESLEARFWSRGLGTVGGVISKETGWGERKRRRGSGRTNDTRLNKHKE